MKGFFQGASLLVMAVAAQTAHAQPSATSPPVAATAAQPATIAATAEPTPPSATGGGQVEEVVVTAQRRSESLQRTALAVSAVDAAGLRNAGVSQPQDLTKLIPALQIASIGGSGTQVTIRGVGNLAPFLYNEPAVAINYDGVYLARSAAPNGLFFDLERVEVLKGPQGTLYGRNATGGAINVISAKPKLDTYSVSAETEFGSYNLKRGSIALNAPLGDTAAIRIAAQVVDRDGYLSDGYLDDKGQAVRGQILWKPTSKLSVDLEADYIHQGGKGPGSVFSTPAGYIDPANPYLGPSSAASNAILRNASLGITNGANPNFIPPLGADGFTDLNIVGTSATIDYDLDWAKLTVIPAYRNTENNFLQYAGGFPVHSTEKSTQYSLEARLASTRDGPLKWVLGGYYFNDGSNLYALAQQGVTSVETITPSLSTESYAFFAQSTYSVTSRLRLTGGIRYTDEHKTQRGTNESALPPVPTGFPAPAAVFYSSVCQSPATLSLAAGTCLGPFSGDLSFNKITGKVGLEFDLGPRSLLYISYETGFKAGGFYPSSTPNTFQPEEIKAYTIGSKNRFFSNRLQLNLEGFYWDYSNKQVTHLGAIRPFGYSLITENAGAATVGGFEADMIWRATANDRLSANLQYVYSNYDKFLYNAPLLSSDPNARAFVGCPQTINTDPTSGQRSALVNCSGKPLPLTPQWTLNLSFTHTFHLSGGAGVDATIGSKIQSDYYSGEDFLPGEHQSDSTVSYAQLTYRAADDRYSIGAYVDNIENNAVQASAFVQPVVGVPLVILRPPRTYGVRLGFRY